MKTQTRNEQKTPLFIFIKHLIQDADQKTISRVERYVNNYCKTNAELTDKLNLKTIFNQKTTITMNTDRLYKRLCAEIEKEKTLSEFDKILFRTILLTGFSEEQKQHFEEFCEEQKKFNEVMGKSIAHLELVNSINTHKN